MDHFPLKFKSVSIKNFLNFKFKSINVTFENS